MAARVTRMTKRRLGELLRGEGLVTDEQVKLAMTEQRKQNCFLGEALVKLGFVTEESIAVTVSQQFNLPFLSAEQYDIAKDMLDIFPLQIMQEYQFLPLERIGDMLIIVGAGLMNHDVLDELENICGAKICQYISTWTDIRAVQERLFKDYKAKAKSSDKLTGLGALLLNDTSVGLQRPPGLVSSANAAAAPGAKPAAPAAASAPAAAPAAAQAAAKPAAPAAPAAPKPVAPSAAPAAAQAVAAPKPAPAAAPSAGPAPATGARLSAFAGPRPTAGPAPAPAAGQAAASTAKPAPPPTPNPAKPEAAKDDAKPEERKTAEPAKGGLLGFLKK